MANITRPYDDRKNQRPFVILFNATAGLNIKKALDIPDDLMFVASYYKNEMDFTFKRKRHPDKVRICFRFFDFKNEAHFFPPDIVNFKLKVGRNWEDRRKSLTEPDRASLWPAFLKSSSDSSFWQNRAEQIHTIPEIARNADQRWNGKVVIYGHSILDGRRYISDSFNNIKGTHLALWIEENIYRPYHTKLSEKFNKISDTDDGLSSSDAKELLNRCIERNVTLLNCYIGDATQDFPVRKPERFEEAPIVLEEFRSHYESISVPYIIQGAKTVVSCSAEKVQFKKNQKTIRLYTKNKPDWDQSSWNPDKLEQRKEKKKEVMERLESQLPNSPISELRKYCKRHKVDFFLGFPPNG